MAVAYEVPVRFTVNDRQFQGALAKSSKELNRLADEYENLVKAQNRKSKTDQALSAEAKKLYKANVRALQQAGVISKQTAKNAQAYLKANEELQKYRRELEMLAKVKNPTGMQSARIDAVTKSIKVQEEAVEQLNRDNAVAIEQADRLRKSKTGVAAAFNKAGTEGKWLTSIVNDVSMKLFVLTFAGKQVFDTLINGFVKTGEEVLLFETRVRSLTGSTEAVGPLFDMVNRLGVGFQDAAQAFTRFAVANTTMKRTNQELVQMTETVLSFGLAAGGSIQEVTAGLQQLSQGLASNRLQGDELRSVFENLPIVAKALADELADGSIARLREMGAEGELTGDVVSGALLKATEEAKRLAEALPDTTERAANRVANAWSNAISEILKAVGGTSGVTEAYNSVARGIERVTEKIKRNAELVKDAIEALGPAFIAVFGTIAVQQVGLAVAALVRLIAQLGTASVSLAAFAAPGVAVAIGAVVGSIGFLVKSFEDSRTASDAAKESVDAYTASLKEKDAYVLRQDQSDLTRALESEKEAFEEAALELQNYREKEMELQARLDEATAQGSARAETIQRALDSVSEAINKPDGLNRAYLDARDSVQDANEKLQANKEALVLAEEEVTKAVSSVNDLNEASKELADSQERGLEVLERLNPEMKLYNDYLEDTNALFDVMNASNAEEVFDAMDRLHDEHERGIRALKGYNSATEESAAAAFKNWNIIADSRIDDELRKRIATMIEMEGVQGRLTSGYREYAEQVRLYKKYLAGGPLAAKPGTSLHESGDAIDLVATNKKITKELAEQYGLRVLLYKNSQHVHLELAKEEKVHKRNTSASKALTDAEKERAKAVREQAKAIKDAADEEKRANEVRRQGALTLEQYMKNLKQEAEASKLSTVEKARLRVETELKTRADKLALEATKAQEDGNLKLAEAYRQVEQATRDAIPQAQQLAEKAAEQGEAAESLADMWRGAMEEVGESIQDVLSDAIREGELSMKKFADVIMDTLAELAAAVLQKKIIIPIIGSAAGAVGLGDLFGGGGLTGAGNLLSGVPGIGNAVSGIGSLFSAGGTALNFGAAALSGAGLAGGLGSQAAMLAGQTGVFGAAGASATASALGSAATGVTGALSGLASGISAALPVLGPLALLGGMTGMFDGLFGGGEKTPKGYVTFTGGGSGISKTQGDVDVAMMAQAANDFDAAVDALLPRLSSDGRRTAGQWDVTADPGKYGTDVLFDDFAGDVSGSMSAFDSKALKRSDSMAEFFQQLQALDQLWASAASSIAAMTGDDALGPLEMAREMSEVDMERGVEGVQEFAAGVAVAAQIARASGDANQTAAEGLRRLRTHAADLGVELPETRDAFAAMVGEIDWASDAGAEFAKKLGRNAQAFQAYYAVLEGKDALLDRFRSDEERAADSMARVAEVFRTLGQEAPTSTAALRDMIAALDPADADGLKGLQSIADAAEDIDAYFRVLADREEALARAREEQAEAAKKLAEEQAEAAKKLAEEQAEAAQKLADTQAGLNQELLQMANAEAALAAEREAELAQMDPLLRATQQRIWALEDEIAAAERAAEVAQERADLELQLLRITDAEAALARERSNALAALDESNRAIQERIWALEDQGAASQTAAEAARAAAAAEQAITEERARLERQILSLEDEEAGLAAQRAYELEQLDESNRAIQERIWALEDEAAAAAAAAAIADERANLMIRLAEAEGRDKNALALRRQQELDALDASNRSILERIHLLEDEAAAAAAAAAIADERGRLRIELLRAQGNEAAALELERRQILAGLDASNRGLQLQIWSLEDAAGAAGTAAESTTSAMDELARAAQGLSDWVDAELRSGDFFGSIDATRDQYLRLIAQASGGDAGAMSALPGVAGDYLAQIKGEATSATDYAVQRGVLLAQMQDVATRYDEEAAAAPDEMTPQPVLIDPQSEPVKINTEELESQYRDLAYQLELLQESIEAGQAAQIKWQRSTAEQLEAWDVNGLPRIQGLEV